MSDGSGAYLFGSMLRMLAENPTDEHKRMARHLYSFAGDYDFSDYEMGADEAGIALGLARRGINERYPEAGETTLWGDQ